MIKLILKYLNKIKQLFVIIPLLIAIMLFAGLFFANKKSEPEFATKAEKIMFETKNKSPKYVIALADDKVTELAKAEKKAEKIEENQQNRTNAEKLNDLDIPFLSRLPKIDGVEPMTYLVPEPSFQQEDKEGRLLPVKNGLQKPWEAYGRKVKVMPMFHKVSVVINNVGINSINTDLIIERMPPNVSLSFSPYATNLVEIFKKARENGHETYLDVILPSRDFATTDSGPLALDFNQDVAKNIKIIKSLLAKNIAVGGVVLRDGVDDAEYNSYFLSIMDVLERRGLILLDATHGLNIGSNNVKGLDRVRADIVIDGDFDRERIRYKLQQAEKRAFRNGNVVIVLEPKPVAVLEVAEWLRTFSKQLSYEEMKEQDVTEFEKPLILVPLSNLVGEY